MTSKYDKDNKVAHEAIAECVCSYHILTSSVIYYWADAWQHEIYLFYIVITTRRAFVYFKILQHNAKAGLLPRLYSLWRRRKKPIWRNLLSIHNEAISLVTMRSKELRLVEENHATVRPDSSVAPCGMETYSESRIELQNLQILKKILEKSSRFLPSEQPCEPKSLGIALKITGVKKIPSGNLCLRPT